MGNTYSQLYIQFVFAVKGRTSFITEDIRDELEKVMCSIVKKQNCKAMAVYCNPDHAHLFVSMHPEVSCSKLMQLVKTGTSIWIKQRFSSKFKFAWQDGYGAFSYSKSQIANVVAYILNQPSHHKKQSFKEEYLSLLNKFGIEFDPKHLFTFY